MSKLIKFNEELKFFHLSNSKISYIFAIEEGGVLSHHHFGKKVMNYRNQLKFPRKDRGFSGNLPNAIHRDYSLDTLSREYSGTGEGDYRTPAILVKQHNGTLTTHFVYDSHQIISGKPKLEGLPSTYYEDTNEVETLIIILSDIHSQLKLELSYSIYDNRSLITRSSRLINESEETVVIEKIASMSVDFPNGEWDVISLPGAHVNERHVSREKVTYGTKKFSSRRGSSSHHMNSFIALTESSTTEFNGEAFGFGLVYSGNHSFEVDCDQVRSTRITVGINEEQFSWILNPKESFQAPEVISVYSEAGLNAMSHTFHDIINDRIVRGKYRHQIRPTLVNNWEATYFDFTERDLKPIVDEAEKLGIEMFVLDDGWFGVRDNDKTSLGDWFVDTRKFPNGLKPFADYVHEKGLKFGLWFEPEMISVDSELYRRHPEFMLKVPDREASPSRSQFVLDLSQKAVRENILDQLNKILNEGYIDYIKWDMNRNISDPYSSGLDSLHQGEVFHRYILGLYEILETLTNDYPEILWEGCSGGGGRFDLGFAYYMPQSWTSDNTDAVARLGIQYGTSMVYPPSVMTSHVSEVPNHQTGRITNLNTRGNVAMSGVLGYELDLTKLTAEEKEQVKNQVSTYKKIRETTQYGRFIRISSPFDRNDCAWMFVNNDQSEFVLFVFRILSQAQERYILTKLSGLNSKYLYTNVDTREQFYGDELMNLGIYQTLKDGDFVSWRYHFKVEK